MALQQQLWETLKHAFTAPYTGNTAIFFSVLALFWTIYCFRFRYLFGSPRDPRQPPCEEDLRQNDVPDDVSPNRAPSSYQQRHHVFLSFRGEDTRNNFTAYLLKALEDRGIDVFFDERKVKKGDELSPVLLGAINNSKISAIVFSENYATSSWCLEEVSHIMKCRRSRDQLVVPIFYHVDPSDVRKQTGSFGRAFVEHGRKGTETNKVQRWRDALKEAANLSGVHLTKDKKEPVVIEDIVKDILSKLNSLTQSGCNKGLIGIGPKLEQIKSLLCIGGEDVRMIGILGMGGIGKTTLAQAVYYKVRGEFESCHFLADVRQEIEKHGAITVRNKLLSRLLSEDNLRIDTPRIGSTLIEDRLRNKRVLVVLDDVNDDEQFEQLAVTHDRFGSGSRIIVTSRDKQVLASGSVDEVYEVKVLNLYDSIQLFSQHAFKQNCLVDDFRDLSSEVLGYAGGVPIALKVLGSALYKKEKEYWVSTMNNLKEHPKPKVFDLLKISFDGLDDDVERDIFLDIACFFNGEEKEHVTTILDSVYPGKTYSSLSNLVDKCLLAGVDDIFSMHDLLQEMGREIVRRESKKPGERSRLWAFEDVCQVLTSNKGTESIKAISLDMLEREDVEINPVIFESMVNLKFIKFSNAIKFSDDPQNGLSKLLLVNQDLACLPNGLSHFEWEAFPSRSLPSKFNPNKLVKFEFIGFENPTALE